MFSYSVHIPKNVNLMRARRINPRPNWLYSGPRPYHRVTNRLTLVLRIRNHPKPFPRPSHANSTTPFDAVVQTKPLGAGSRHNSPSWAVAVSRLGIRVLRLIFVGQSRLGTESRARRHTATFVGTWRGPSRTYRKEVFSSYRRTCTR